MIFERDDFLSQDQCSRLIKIYNDNIDESFKYRDTFPLNVKKHIRCEDDRKYISIISSHVTEICNLLKSEKKSLNLQNLEIVRWPPGSHQQMHYDPPGDVFACILYLNSDFTGGQTYFENGRVVNPETGKLLIFSNSTIKHGVKEILRHDRYTLAFWYI